MQEFLQDLLQSFALSAYMSCFCFCTPTAFMHAVQPGAPTWQQTPAGKQLAVALTAPGTFAPEMLLQNPAKVASVVDPAAEGGKAVDSADAAEAGAAVPAATTAGPVTSPVGAKAAAAAAAEGGQKEGGGGGSGGPSAALDIPFTPMTLVFK